MPQLPRSIDPGVAARLLPAIDREGKIARALDALGPVSDRDVLLVTDGRSCLDAAALGGTRVTELPARKAFRLPVEDRSADAVVTAWSAFDGVSAGDLAEADRVLRDQGRLLVVHDYGRDDVSGLYDADRPAYGDWSNRKGPFLSRGFRIRVLHCWWTFESLEDAAERLAEAFGGRGAELAGRLRRPRLSYKVAVYHRTRAGA